MDILKLKDKIHERFDAMRETYKSSIEGYEREIERLRKEMEELESYLDGIDDAEVAVEAIMEDERLKIMDAAEKDGYCLPEDCCDCFFEKRCTHTMLKKGGQ